MGSSNIVSMAPIPDTADIQLSRLVINGTNGATIAGVANKRIWVFGAHFNGTVQPFDGGSVAQSGTISASGTPAIFPYQQYPWWTAAAGNALVFSAAAALNGAVLYVQG